MKKSHEKGFTLAEILVVITLMGILSLAMMGMVNSYQNNFVQSRTDSEYLENANFAMNLITRELRETPYSSVSMTNASLNNSLTFLAGASNVTYSFNSNRLLRGTEVLAENVVSLQFRYVSTTGTLSFTKSRGVNIQLAMNNNGTTMTLTDTVYIRNP